MQSNTLKSVVKSKAFANLAIALAFGLLMADSANAADIFDRIAYFTSRLPLVKVFAIAVGFLGGIVAVVWAGFDMIKKSQHDERDISWLGIGIKFLAGAVLVTITATSDLLQNTIFGSGGSSGGGNTSAIEPEVKVARLDLKNLVLVAKDGASV